MKITKADEGKTVRDPAWARLERGVPGYMSWVKILFVGERNFFCRDRDGYERSMPIDNQNEWELVEEYPKSGCSHMNKYCELCSPKKPGERIGEIVGPISPLTDSAAVALLYVAAIKQYLDEEWEKRRE